MGWKFYFSTQLFFLVFAITTRHHHHLFTIYWFWSDLFYDWRSFKGSKDAGLNQRRTRYKDNHFSYLFYTHTHVLLYFIFLVTVGSYNYFFMTFFCIFFFSFLFHYHSCCIFVLSILCCLLLYILLSIYFSCECEIVKKTENDIKNILLCLMSIGGCEHSTFLYAVVLIVVASVQCVMFKHQNVIACHIMDQDFQRPGKTHSIAFSLALFFLKVLEGRKRVVLI